MALHGICWLESGGREVKSTKRQAKYSNIVAKSLTNKTYVQWIQYELKIIIDNKNH